MKENQKDSWEESYRRGDNFVLYPHEEVIRFVSKYIRKRVGFNDFLDVTPLASSLKVLDLGCGVGRHMKYFFEMGLEGYGVDLSETAIKTARSWLSDCGMSDTNGRIVQGDVRQLPWENGYFLFAVSHGVLDSMPWEIARAACLELARVMTPGGLFYCDLISGDDSSHAREFSGSEVVTTKHEENTVQLYFNMQLINDLIKDAFSIEDCKLIRTENVKLGGYYSRYHLVLSRIG